MSSEKSRADRYKESANRAQSTPKALEIVANTAAQDSKLADDEKQSVANYIESIKPKSRKKK